MKLGQLVQHTLHDNNTIRGVIVELDPFRDGLHTRIFWADPDEPNGITSIWANEDFEILNRSE